jgi:transcriptional regulator with XRE-family HTH domain
MAALHELLRQARTSHGLSQQALAARARLSEESVFSYEAGRRVPTRSTLVRLLRATGLAAERRNDILVAAGFDPEPSGQLATLAAQRLLLGELQQEIRRYPWPCLATNERTEIVAWNDAALQVAELDFATQLPTSYQRNLLRLAAMRHFRDRVENWEAVVSFLIAQYKYNQMNVLAPEEDSQWFVAVVEDIGRIASDVFPQLLQLWQTVPARPEGGRDWFEVRWRTGNGVPLRFHCVLSSWSDFDAVWAFDWHPADGATWNWLDTHTSRSMPDEVPSSPLVSSSSPTPASHTAAPDNSEPSWRQLLRWGRDGSGLSRPALAAQAAVSEETIRSYETGRRPPSRELVLRLTRAMELDGLTTNAILTGAGLEPEPSEWSLFLAGLPRRSAAKRYQSTSELQRSLASMQQAIAEYAWPCLLVNDVGELIAASPAATQLFDVGPDGSLLGEPDRSLVRLIFSQAFRERAQPWEDIVTTVLPGTLRQATATGSGANGTRALQSVIEDLRKNDPDSFRRLAEQWAAKPAARSTVRVTFSAMWRQTAETTLRFSVLITPWSAFDSVWAIDWYPADAATSTWIGG